MVCVLCVLLGGPQELSQLVTLLDGVTVPLFCHVNCYPGVYILTMVIFPQHLLNTGLSTRSQETEDLLFPPAQGRVMGGEGKGRNYGKSSNFCGRACGRSMKCEGERFLVK